MRQVTSKQFVDAAVAKLPLWDNETKQMRMQILYQTEMCDGFVRNSIKRAGGDMGRYAGSNDMLRNALTKLAPLNSASGKEFLVPGALLFIVKPGHNGKYNDELGDASHVGIYTQRPEAEVTHSSQSKGGVVPSTLKNAWTHVGLAKAVDYSASQAPTNNDTDYGGRGGELDMSDQTTTTVPNMNTLYRVVLPAASAGQTVNFRKNAQPEGVIYAKIPDGTLVMAGGIFTSWGFEWRSANYNGLNGYIMAQFLQASDSAMQEPDASAPTYTPVEIPPYAQNDPVEYRIQQLERQIDYILQETGIKKIGG